MSCAWRWAAFMPLWPLQHQHGPSWPTNPSQGSQHSAHMPDRAKTSTWHIPSHGRHLLGQSSGAVCGAEHPFRQAQPGPEARQVCVSPRFDIARGQGSGLGVTMKRKVRGWVGLGAGGVGGRGWGWALNPSNRVAGARRAAGFLPVMREKSKHSSWTGLGPWSFLSCSLSFPLAFALSLPWATMR